MAITYSTEAALYLNNTPAQMASGNAHGGRLRVYRCTITLASQAQNDEIILARIPSGSSFLYGVFNSTVSLGSSTVSIGDASTEASADPDRYRAAATMTTANAPTFFGHTAGSQEAALTSDRVISLTVVGAAALPASGTLTVDIVVVNA